MGPVPCPSPWALMPSIVRKCGSCKARLVGIPSCHLLTMQSITVTPDVSTVAGVIAPLEINAVLPVQKKSPWEDCWTSYLCFPCSVAQVWGAVTCCGIDGSYGGGCKGCGPALRHTAATGSSRGRAVCRPSASQYARQKPILCGSCGWKVRLPWDGEGKECERSF